MTKRELYQLQSLNREIAQDKQRLAELEAVATGTTSAITGLPHAAGIADKTSLAAEIADSREIIGVKIRQSVAEYNRLNRYITSIEDSHLRQILTLRFVDGFGWSQVAACIGGGNTADGIKKAYYRFLHHK